MEKIPGRRLAKKAEETGNQIGVPMARDLGLVELLKRTFKEVEEDHLAAFAGNLTYKGLFIEEVYNDKRLHSSLGYLPPAEFEAIYALKAGS